MEGWPMATEKIEKVAEASHKRIMVICQHAVAEAFSSPELPSMKTVLARVRSAYIDATLTPPLYQMGSKTTDGCYATFGRKVRDVQKLLSKNPPKDYKDFTYILEFERVNGQLNDTKITPIYRWEHDRWQPRKPKRK
jgi:hypothetical protein